MRRLLAIVSALTAAGAWFVVTAPSGTAAGTLEAAWWSQAESTTGAVPPPPTVPEGGLWVSANPTGAEAVSAIRVPLDPGESAPVLRLSVHQATPGALDLAAFPTTSAWSPGPAQAWSSKPAYDPGGVSAKGTLSGDGKEVTFDVSGLVTSNALNVVIAPTAAAASPAPPPLPAPPPSPPTFDVTFEKPDAGSFHVESTPVADTAPSEFVAPDTSSDLGAADVSLTPALPTGLEASPSTVSPAPPPAVASPPVVFRSVPRRILPVATKRSFGDSAAIAVMLGIVLLWVAREGGPRLGGQRRPRLTIYDTPERVQAVAVPRPGSPPALR